MKYAMKEKVDYGKCTKVPCIQKSTLRQGDVGNSHDKDKGEVNFQVSDECEGRCKDNAQFHAKEHSSAGEPKEKKRCKGCNESGKAVKGHEVRKFTN